MTGIEGQVDVINLSGVYNQKDDSHGGISEMSVLEPLPGRFGLGLTNVVSMRVQCSPLRRQFPSCYRRHEQMERLLWETRSTDQFASTRLLTTKALGWCNPPHAREFGQPGLELAGFVRKPYRGKN